MQRGRPSKDDEIRPLIIEVLKKTNAHVNISYIKRYVEEELKSGISWNTIYRLVQELIRAGKVEPFVTTRSKGKRKVTFVVYSLRS